MRGNNMTEMIDRYISSNIGTPFFAVTGDRNYNKIKSELSAKGISFIKTSKFCGDNDKRPDLDKLFQHIETLDINSNNKAVALVGLGEYLALCGEQVAHDKLFELKELKIDNVKVILLLRGVTEVVKRLQRDDLRFDSLFVWHDNDTITKISTTFISPHILLPAFNGIKELLQAFEDFENGTDTDFFVKSVIQFDTPLIQVHTFSSAYKAIKHNAPHLALKENALSDDQWNELLQSLWLLSEEQDISAINYLDWHCFVRLKNKGVKNNGYLNHVLECTDTFSDFKQNVLNAIIDIPHTDKRFDKFYSERKTLMDKFNDSDIAEFVMDNRKNISESIYKLTDKTKAEREEIIALFSNCDKQTLLRRIEITYPVLFDYLYTYKFNCGELSELLTSYFDEYKWQKLLNKIDDGFVNKVESLANGRKYFLLPTRNEIISDIEKEDTYLYWLDALGVEFLGFIQSKCKQLGLAITIHVARAELPTITTINRDFYDNWQGDKYGNKELDDVKHKPNSDYDHKKDKRPIHLARELEIISDVLTKVATKLALRNYSKFLIVSDHGASRLAVIKEQEEKYKTDTKGEHGGRCCKAFSPYDLPFAAEENGYLILANYGRFKGSRKSDVEVHGGASLEEVIVPIIELTLANPNIKVELTNNEIIASYRNNAELNLFSKSKLQNLTLDIKGKRYDAVKSDTDNHWVVTTDIYRTGEYSADVFTGDNLIGKLAFTIQSEMGKKNDAFDALF